jgi:hypothetical protein
MNLGKDRRGFIFSLDATLAMLVVMLAMAGVAHVGGLDPIYEQHGYLRLQQYANSALDVLYNTGRVENDLLILTIDEIKDLLAEGTQDNLLEAESLAENQLRKILPGDIQFRFRIGTENDPILDNVYPSAGNHGEWQAAFDNTGEIAVANRVIILGSENFEPVTIWVWRGPGI